jgi:hypothetical protein
VRSSSAGGVGCSRPSLYQATALCRAPPRLYPDHDGLGRGVFLTTRELGVQHLLWAGLVTNGTLLPTCCQRQSLSPGDRRDQVQKGARTAPATASRLSLNWRGHAGRFRQVSSVWSGDQLLAQGKREQSTARQPRLRRRDDKWSLQMTRAR